jgi:hypothetical protein
MRLYALTPELWATILKTLLIIQRFSFALILGDTEDFQVVDLGVLRSSRRGGTIGQSMA